MKCAVTWCVHSIATGVDWACDVHRAAWEKSPEKAKADSAYYGAKAAWLQRTCAENDKPNGVHKGA